MALREIVFRGKRLDNGEWVEGFLLKECNYAACAWNLGIEYKTDRFGRFAYEVAEVNPETVGQFTGLTDKNGKKIFEGDIVEYNNCFDYFKGCVVFENGAFGLGSYDVIGLSSGCCDNFANLWQLFWDQEVTDEPELYYCTVIGNIHDNPELLEGGAEDGVQQKDS